jgi:hypothetical protein
MSFVIPRASLAATVRLIYAEAQAGEIFVMQRASHHDGQETPLDMLNRPEGFFPFRAGTDKHVMLVSKASTVTVNVARAAAGMDPDRLAAAHEISVEVTLTNSEVVTGQVYSEQPAHASRFLDYLNATHDFFFTVVTKDTVTYLNRAHVLHARPIE